MSSIPDPAPKQTRPSRSRKTALPVDAAAVNEQLTPNSIVAAVEGSTATVKTEVKEESTSSPAVALARRGRESAKMVNASATPSGTPVAAASSSRKRARPAAASSSKAKGTKRVKKTPAETLNAVNGEDTHPVASTSALQMLEEEVSSSDDDAAVAVAQLLLGRTPDAYRNLAQLEGEHPHTHTDALPDTEAPAEIPPQFTEGSISIALLAAVAGEEAPSFPIPRVNDQYSSMDEFMRHVKLFSERTGHKTYQMGGQGKHNCRMICRNWKKPEYKPPGLGCKFHFLAQKSMVSSTWTIISADPNHNEVCKRHEGDTDTTVYDSPNTSNSKKLTKEARDAARAATTPSRKGRGRPPKPL